MLKNLVTSSLKKPPKILPKPHPPSPQSGSTKDRLKAFLLKESITTISIPKLASMTRPQNTARRKKQINSNSTGAPKSESVTIEERNREAARRYRQRVKVLQYSLAEDNDKLKAENKQLREENVNLKRKIAKLQTELAAAKHHITQEDISDVPATTSQYCIIIPPSSIRTEQEK